MSEQSSPWILRAPARRQALHEGAAAAAAAATAPAAPRLSVVCFPPAGSGGSMFPGWQEELPEGVDVLAVELPGRSSRLREPAIDSMQQLVRELLPALLPALSSRPFVLFGHSMGSWVAYQLTLDLQRLGGPLPLKLYASANRSPLLAGPEHDVDPTLMHALPPEEFWPAMERRYGANPNLDSPAVQRMLLPALRADFKLVETWRPAASLSLSLRGGSGAALGEAAVATAAGDEQAPAPGGGLPLGENGGAQPQQQQRGPHGREQQQQLAVPCPVAALGARSDTRYTRGQLAAWAQIAPAGGFEEHWFEGGHSYIASATPGRQQLLDWLAADLQRLLQGLESSSASGGSSRTSVDGHGQNALPTPASHQQPPESSHAPLAHSAAAAAAIPAPAAAVTTAVVALHPPGELVAARQGGRSADMPGWQHPCMQQQLPRSEGCESPQLGGAARPPETHPAHCWCW